MRTERDGINEALARLAAPTRKHDEEPQDSECDWTASDLAQLWASIGGEYPYVTIGYQRDGGYYYAEVGDGHCASGEQKTGNDPDIALARAILNAKLGW